MGTILKNQIKGVVQHRLDDWRDARVERIAPPVLGPEQVLIATEAASLNFADLLMMEGKYQHKAPLPYVPGRDAAGTVLAIGNHVTAFRPGDRVIATPNHGAFAQQTVASTAVCHEIPDGVSMETAAACGTGIPTIVAAVRLRAGLRPGEWVLISGAAGGMGSLAVSYAKALGARLVALVSSAEKEQLVLDLGADFVIRTDELTELKAGLRSALQARGLQGVDAAIDMVGGETFEAMIRCIKPEGRLVVVGFASGRIPSVAANYLLLKDIAVIGSSITRLFVDRPESFLRLCDDAYAMVAEGRLQVAIDSRHPLDRFVEAASRIANRQAVGKIILLPQAP